MRVAVIGAGSVGRSIARELIQSGHDLTLIDAVVGEDAPARVPEATWVTGDACEISTLTFARLESFDAVVCATGDDKVNLVASFLAKTEFAVGRTVARVNNPRNEWLFGEAWGVDVAVSTPRIMTALVEEAVSVGDLVSIFTFQQSKAQMLEMTLPESSPSAGRRLGDLDLPAGVAVAAVIRDGQAIAPSPDDVLAGRDEVLIIAPQGVEADVSEALNPGSVYRDRDADDTGS